MEQTLQNLFLIKISFGFSDFDLKNCLARNKFQKVLTKLILNL